MARLSWWDAMKRAHWMAHEQPAHWARLFERCEDDEHDLQPLSVLDLQHVWYGCRACHSVFRRMKGRNGPRPEGYYIPPMLGEDLWGR